MLKRLSELPLDVFAVLSAMLGPMVAIGTVVFDEWYSGPGGRDAEQFAIFALIFFELLAIVLGIARRDTVTGKSAMLTAAVMLGGCLVLLS
jgi:hypothetical protein